MLMESTFWIGFVCGGMAAVIVVGVLIWKLVLSNMPIRFK